MFDAFLSGTPSVYDMLTFIVCVLILLLQLSFHGKQMRNSREIVKLKEALRERSE